MMSLIRFEESLTKWPIAAVFGAAFKAVIDRLKEKGPNSPTRRCAPWATSSPICPPDLLAFFHDRLKVHLRDEGIRHDIIDAALAKPPADDLALVVARARALAGFLATPDGENLVQGLPPRGQHPDAGGRKGRRRIPLRRAIRNSPRPTRNGRCSRALAKAEARHTSPRWRPRIFRPPP